jgi:hypothetical protein
VRTSGRLPQNDLDQQWFDTYFFVARHPEGQEETPDEKETTVGIWVTPPRQALQENLTGEIVLSPPTLKTLEDLSSYQTPDDVFRSLENRVIRTILPLLTKVSDETVILFPWNPEYERFTRAEIPPRQITESRADPQIIPRGSFSEIAAGYPTARKYRPETKANNRKKSQISTKASTNFLPVVVG